MEFRVLSYLTSPQTGSNCSKILLHCIYLGFYPNASWVESWGESGCPIYNRIHVFHLLYLPSVNQNVYATSSFRSVSSIIKQNRNISKISFFLNFRCLTQYVISPTRASARLIRLCGRNFCNFAICGIAKMLFLFDHNQNVHSWF